MFKRKKVKSVNRDNEERRVLGWVNDKYPDLAIVPFGKRRKKKKEKNHYFVIQIQDGRDAICVPDYPNVYTIKGFSSAKFVMKMAHAFIYDKKVKNGKYYSEARCRRQLWESILPALNIVEAKYYVL